MLHSGTCFLYDQLAAHLKQVKLQEARDEVGDDCQRQGIEIPSADQRPGCSEGERNMSGALKKLWSGEERR